MKAFVKFREKTLRLYLCNLSSPNPPPLFCLPNGCDLISLINEFICTFLVNSLECICMVVKLSVL